MLEVRGADELPAGIYWALYVRGPTGPGTGWLELVAHQPWNNGKAWLGPAPGAMTAPSGAPAVVFGVVVIEPDRSVRDATPEERVRAGGLVSLASTSAAPQHGSRPRRW